MVSCVQRVKHSLCDHVKSSYTLEVVTQVRSITVLKHILATVKFCVVIVPIEDMAIVGILKLLWIIYQPSNLNCWYVTILCLGNRRSIFPTLKTILGHTWMHTEKPSRKRGTEVFHKCNSYVCLQWSASCHCLASRNHTLLKGAAVLVD